MGDAQSAQREESGKAEDTEDKPFKNNKQISEINGKADSATAQVNAHCEDEMAAEDEDISKTATSLKGEVENVEMNGKEAANEADAHEDVPLEMTEMDVKQNDINEGFRRFFRNIGLKLTVKKGTAENAEMAADEMNQEEFVEVATEETKSEEHTDLKTAPETYDNDSTTCPTLTDATSEDVLQNAEEKTTDAKEVAESDIVDASPAHDDEKVQQDAALDEDQQPTSESEVVVSPIKRFFTTGIFSGLQKKKKLTEDEISEKELMEIERKHTVEEAEGCVNAQQEKEEISLGVEADPDETGQKDNKLKEEILPAASAQATDDAVSITVNEPEILSYQEKVQASPLKRLLSGSNLKKLSKKQKGRRSSDSRLSDFGDQFSDQLLSFKEPTEHQKEESPAAGEEGAWASFRKLVTPKKHPKTSAETQIPGSEEQTKPSDREQISSYSTEEGKKRKDSSVSWDAVLCGSGRRRSRSRKTSDSEDETPPAENDNKKHQSPPESSNEVDESSHKKSGSPSEADGGSTWKSFKKLVTPKRKLKDEEENRDTAQSDSEVPRDDSSFSIKKLLPGRKKSKSSEKQDQTSSDEADKDVASADEDSETPAVVPLSEFDAVETGVHIQTQAAVESHVPKEAEYELQHDLQDHTAEPLVPFDNLPTEIKKAQDEQDVLENEGSTTPTSNEEAEDLTEIISKHQQLSDIPEEGIITETMATPASAAEETARDDTLAEDLIEITSEAITAPEPVDVTLTDETEMISAVSQLSESSKTSGNTTPVPEEQDVKQTETLLHQVVETISTSPKEGLLCSDEINPERIVGSVSHQVLEMFLKEEPAILEIHRSSDATAINIGLNVEELDAANKHAVKPQRESVSEVNQSVSKESVPEVPSVRLDTAEIGVDEVHEVSVSHPEESIKELDSTDDSQTTEAVFLEALPEDEEIVADEGSVVGLHQEEIVADKGSVVQICQEEIVAEEGSVVQIPQEEEIVADEGSVVGLHQEEIVADKGSVVQICQEEIVAEEGSVVQLPQEEEIVAEEGSVVQLPQEEEIVAEEGSVVQIPQEEEIVADEGSVVRICQEEIVAEEGSVVQLPQEEEIVAEEGSVVQIPQEEEIVAEEGSVVQIPQEEEIVADEGSVVQIPQEEEIVADEGSVVGLHQEEEIVADEVSVVGLHQEEIVADEGSVVQLPQEEKPLEMDSHKAESAATQEGESKDGGVEQEVQTLTQNEDQVLQNITDQVEVEDKDKLPVEELQEAAMLNSEGGGVQLHEREIISEDSPATETHESKEETGHLTEDNVEAEREDEPQADDTEAEHVEEADVLETVRASLLDSEEGGAHLIATETGTPKEESVQLPEGEVPSKDIPTQSGTDETKEATENVSEISAEPENKELKTIALNTDNHQVAEVLQTMQEPTPASEEGGVQLLDKDEISETTAEVETVPDELKVETESLVDDDKPVDALETEHAPEIEAEAAQVTNLVSEEDGVQPPEKTDISEAIPEAETLDPTREPESNAEPEEDVPEVSLSRVNDVETEAEAEVKESMGTESGEEGRAEKPEKQISAEGDPEPDSINATASVTEEIQAELSRALEHNEEKPREITPQEDRAVQEDNATETVGELQTLAAVNGETADVQVRENVFSEMTPPTCVNNAEVTHEPEHEVHLSTVHVSIEGELPAAEVKNAVFEDALVSQVVTCYLKEASAAIPDASTAKTSENHKALIDTETSVQEFEETVMSAAPQDDDEVTESAEEGREVPTAQIEDSSSIQVQVVDVDVKSAQTIVDRVLQVGVTETKEVIDVCQETFEEVDHLSATSQTEELINEEKVTVREVIQHVKEKLPAAESLNVAMTEEAAAAAQQEVEDLTQTFVIPGSSDIICNPKEDLEETKPQLETSEADFKTEEVKLPSEELDRKKISEEAQISQMTQSQIVTHSNTGLVVPQNAGIISSVGSVDSPSSISLEFKINIQFGQAKAAVPPQPAEEKDELVKKTDVSQVEPEKEIIPPQSVDSQRQTEPTEASGQATEIRETVHSATAEKMVVMNQPILLDMGVQAIETVEPVEEIKSTERVTLNVQATETIQPVRQTEKREVFLSQPVLSEAVQETKPKEPVKPTKEENEDVWLDAEEEIYSQKETESSVERAEEPRKAESDQEEKTATPRGETAPAAKTEDEESQEEILKADATCEIESEGEDFAFALEQPETASASVSKLEED
ncbi:titin [Echeneis naucrates]|uniref:titin n=1 Tax=Echeneis naucrates TaxID=173247 RepID=UPI00111354C3|nr:titin-like [Echeneis naucrates]